MSTEIAIFSRVERLVELRRLFFETMSNIEKMHAIISMVNRADLREQKETAQKEEKQVGSNVEGVIIFSALLFLVYSFFFRKRKKR